jgi:hypothetical protein
MSSQAQGALNRATFEKHLGTRGIPWDRRDVWERAFFRYERDGDPENLYVGDPPDGTNLRTAQRRARQLATRSGGFVMRRFPVPEADPFLFAEMRPDIAIWSGKPASIGRHSGMGKLERDWHVARAKTRPEHVVNGVTKDELLRLMQKPGWDVTHGGDHDWRDTTKVHVHVKLAKYLFPANQKRTESVWHDHQKHSGRELADHLYQEHRWPSYEYAPDAPDVGDADVLGDQGRALVKFMRKTGTGKVVSFMGGRYVRTVEFGKRPSRTKRHPHDVSRDVTFYARRLSSHPIGFERIAGAERVCFAMEGCLKEASLAVVGEATVSCPSVTLWDAPELGPFAASHLRGKTVLVIPDSDWDPAVRANGDDAVYRQAILLRECLRLYGARAYIAAPPHPEDCAKGCDKHGVDDHLAHGVTGTRRGTVAQLVLVDVEAQPFGTLAAWYESEEIRNRLGRKLRTDRKLRDEAVIWWLALLAGEDGVTRVPLTTLARYVQGLLDAPTYQAAVQAVWRAVHDMNDAGVLSGAEHLKEYRKYPKKHHVFEEDNLPGAALTIHEDLRAEFRVDRKVRELEGR